MKKAAIFISAIILFAGLTFAQTPQKADKAKSNTPAKVETKKDSKANCDPKTCTHAGKTGCCAHDGMKKEEKKSEQAPDKK